MGNKRLIVAIIIVILLIAAVIGGFFYLQNSSKQAVVLQEEMSKVAEVDIIEDEIDMNIKSSGKYAVVEEAVKNYLNNAKNLYLELENYCSDSEISNILSAENIEADVTELSVVTQKLEEYSSKLEQNINKTKNITDQSTIMDAIQDKKLSDYYNNIYKNIMLSEAIQSNLSSAKQEIEEEQETAEEKLEGLEKAVDFLKDNTKYWELDDGKIAFTNINKLGEYYKLLYGSIKN